jgi:SAM-dependent methyltransferase
MRANPLEFTGERFVPGIEGEIAQEHWHRYAFARNFVAGRRVADVACGEGYGSALLAGSAASVVGVDMDSAAIAHARESYGTLTNLRFVEGSASALPLPDASVDAVVSFETIEHLEARDQPAMIAEFTRVLAPGGLLVLSSPNRPEYSDARAYVNPFHLHELDRVELERLLDGAFGARRWYRQRRYLGSALWSEDAAGSTEQLTMDGPAVSVARAPSAMYFVVIAAREPGALPPGPGLSLFTESDDREWKRIDAQAREVLRLDALLKQRDGELAGETARVLHFQALVAERDRQLAPVARERDEAREAVAAQRQQIQALEDERHRLERAIGAQERIIAYRQSARWWVRLPFVRVMLLWKRIRGG